MVGNLKKGIEVMVALPPNEKTLEGSPLKQFDGMESTITNVKKVKSYIYYELAGAVSKYGVPYAFLRDWLIEMR